MPYLTHLAVAEVSRPHGLAGEIKARSLSDHPEQLEGVALVYLKIGEDYVPRRVERCRSRGDTIYWQLEGVSTPQAVDALRRQLIYVERKDAAPLEPGAHYIAELLGLGVMDVSGEALGTLVHIFRTGSNDVYEVRRPDGALFYLPVIPNVVRDIDMENAVITVDAAFVLNGETIR